MRKLSPNPLLGTKYSQKVLLQMENNLKTGKRVSIPPASERPNDWFSFHEWRIDIDAVSRLREQSDMKNSTIYLCGVAEEDEIILPYFNKIIYLAIEDDQLLQRLINRTENDFGKNENEREMILKRKNKLDSRYKKMNAHMVDASQSINNVATSITNISKDENG